MVVNRYIHTLEFIIQNNFSFLINKSAFDVAYSFMSAEIKPGPSSLRFSTCVSTIYDIYSVAKMYL